MDMYNAAFSIGSCSSKLYEKNVENMLPFNQQCWNFVESDGYRKHSMNPSVTGTSVLGIKFDEGVMICADILGSYGKLARFLNFERIKKVNDQIMIGVGGDTADFQYLSSIIEQQVINEECLNDGFKLKPKSLHCWLTRTLYNRRSKMEPLWNSYIVAGMQNGKPFLGLVDKLGLSYEAPSIATGFGSYFAQPLLRERLESNPNITEQEALDLMKHCLRILYYRDAVAFPKFTIGIVTKEGVRLEGPVEIDTDWSLARVNQETV